MSSLQLVHGPRLHEVRCALHTGQLLAQQGWLWARGQADKSPCLPQSLPSSLSWIRTSPFIVCLPLFPELFFANFAHFFCGEGVICQPLPSVIVTVGFFSDKTNEFWVGTCYNNLFTTHYKVIIINTYEPVYKWKFIEGSKLNVEKNMWQYVA